MKNNIVGLVGPTKTVEGLIAESSPLLKIISREKLRRLKLKKSTSIIAYLQISFVMF